MIDHCTFWLEGSWAHCCAAHDIAFSEATVSTVAANVDLAVCVAATSGGWPMAVIMFVGVSVGGWWFRWRARRR